MSKSKLTINIPDKKYDGGDALTPPMGWSSWNTFRNHIDENLIYETAVAMKETGLADAGYRYINLDDCWHSSSRDKNGCLQGDFGTFSHGIKNLVERINALDLKVGIYSSNGEYTCEDLPASLGNELRDAKTFADWGIEYFKYDFCHNIKIPSAAPLVAGIELRSENSIKTLFSSDAVLSGFAMYKKDKESGYITLLGHGKGRAVFETENDSDETAALTVLVKKKGKFDKYLIVKVNDDFYELFVPHTKSWSYSGRYQLNVRLSKGRNTIELFNPVCTRADSSYIQYKRMGEALKSVPDARKITYSICEWGRNKPKNWAWNAGNLWRTTPDIRPVWSWINVIYNKNVKLCEYASPGHWNDPDMLEVGNGKLTDDENKTHFSLWCMMASPLILGNDLRKLKDNKNVLDIITNRDMIAINQDKLGKQCIRYRRTASFDFLVKELENGKNAVCIYNKTNRNKSVVLSSAILPDGISDASFKTTEIWTGKAVENGSEIALKPHGCAVFVLN